MISLLLTIGFAIAVFACLFLYIAIGMAVGDFQPNVFLAWVLGFAAIVGGTCWYWRWSRPPKKDPDS
jgi:hypothetical protein